MDPLPDSPEEIDERLAAELAELQVLAEDLQRRLNAVSAYLRFARGI